MLQRFYAEQARTDLDNLAHKNIRFDLALALLQTPLSEWSGLIRDAQQRAQACGTVLDPGMGRANAFASF
jgi:hypothetical protein